MSEYQKTEDTQDALRALGAHVWIRRRQLAHREKTYLRVVAKGGPAEWRTNIMPTICKYFPDAYVTSGGYGPVMNLTVALER